MNKITMAYWAISAQDFGSELVGKFMVLDTGGPDKRASLVGQFERLAPIVAYSVLDRRYTFPNLQHATGALSLSGSGLPA